MHLDLLPTILEAATVPSPNAIPAGGVTATPIAYNGVTTSNYTAAAAAAATTAFLSGAHGRSLLDVLRNPQTYPASQTGARDARPVFLEIGYARAVRHAGYKLIVVNDAVQRCHGSAAAAATGLGVTAHDDATLAPACRNFHGQRIDPPLPAATTDISVVYRNGSLMMPSRRFGLGNMTYDAAARHAAFCDRRQLYDLNTDPLEQHNIARERPEKYRELLAMLVQHVRIVEQGNPAISRQGKRSLLGLC